MPPPLLTLQDVHLTFGGTPLLEGAELSIGERERVCLVGRNGSGKSTLLKIAAGQVEADRGTRFAQPGATVRYLAQEPDLAGFATTLAYVEAGLAPGDEAHRARYLLEQLGLSGAEDPARLSGGEARRAALARVLAPQPDILLLDEPTNHLDLPAIEWLESELAGSRSALVLISHDRRFLQKLSRATVWLDRGVTRRIERGFASFEEWRDQVLEEEEREQHKLGRKIVAEEHWMRYGVTARRKRNMRRVGLLAQMRKDFREHRGAQGSVKIAVSEAELSGKLVAEAERISKSFGDDADRARFLDPHPARRPDRAGRAERRRQDHAAQAADRRVGAGRGQDHARRQPADGDARPAARAARSEYVGARHADRRARRLGVRRRADAPRRRLHEGLPVRAGAGRHRGLGALRRRARPPHAGAGAGETIEPAGARRADQRSRSRNARPARGDDRRLSGHRAAGVARPRFPRSHGFGRRGRGGRRTLERLCRRLHRHGGAARRRRDGEGGREDRSESTARKSRSAGERAKARLSFKDKHALETLPARIAALEAEIAKLSKTIADPGLYARDRAAFDQASAALAKAQADLAGAEDEWLRLEELREQVEAR